MSTLEEWDNKLRLGLAMASIIILLLIWARQRLISYIDNRRSESTEASNNETTHLSREERKQLLNKFFDLGKHRMVSPIYL